MLMLWPTAVIPGVSHVGALFIQIFVLITTHVTDVWHQQPSCVFWSVEKNGWEKVVNWPNKRCLSFHWSAGRVEIYAKGRRGLKQCCQAGIILPAESPRVRYGWPDLGPFFSILHWPASPFGRANRVSGGKLCGQRISSIKYLNCQLRQTHIHCMHVLCLTMLTKANKNGIIAVWAQCIFRETTVIIVRARWTSDGSSWPEDKGFGRLEKSLILFVEPGNEKTKAFMSESVERSQININYMTGNENSNSKSCTLFYF